MMRQPKINLSASKLNRNFLTYERTLAKNSDTGYQVHYPATAHDNSHFGVAIGNYRIGALLGQGGYSQVFAGTHCDTNDVVALKVPRSDDALANLRIKHEYRAVRQLRHPGIVPMHSLMRVGSRYVIAMESLQRASFLGTLRNGLKPGELPDLGLLQRHCSNLLATLAHAHNCGWIHGDIKPDNVMLSNDNGARWIDFGLATNLHRPAWVPAATDLVGTFAYLPPESIVGEPVDPSADMFSFGRMLSILLSGRLPSWDPSLGTMAADARIREQLPINTPTHLIELCTSLVRIAPVHRPTAQSAYQMLNQCDLPAGQILNGQIRNDHAVDHRWQDQVQDLALEIMRRSETNKGCFALVNSDFHRGLQLETILHATPSAQPRLTLPGHCDPSEQTPLPAFDSLLDLLAIWIEQLHPTVTKQWHRFVGPATSQVAPSLFAVLNRTAKPSATDVPGHPSPDTIVRACHEIDALLGHIAKQRTLILVLHGVNRMDNASAQLLQLLWTRMASTPIVIVGTIDTMALDPGQHKATSGASDSQIPLMKLMRNQAHLSLSSEFS